MAYSTYAILAHSGRMNYFRENSSKPQPQLCIKIYCLCWCAVVFMGRAHTIPAIHQNITSGLIFFLENWWPKIQFLAWNLTIWGFHV